MIKSTKKTKKGKYDPKGDPRNGSRTGGIAKLLSGGYALPIWISIRGNPQIAYYIDIVSNAVEYVYYFNPDTPIPLQKTVITRRHNIQVLPMKKVSPEQLEQALEYQKQATEECTPSLSKEVK